jgi:hypothetical protein
MVYRIQICVEDHSMTGARQDRELDLELFTAIVTGQHPQGDGDAHNRDSSQHGGQNRTCYYHAVWNPETMTWISNVQPELVADLYNTCAREAFGG